MPRFTKCIGTHEIHSMHMILGLLCPVCFQYLKTNNNTHSYHKRLSKSSDLKWKCEQRAKARAYERGEPHSVTPEKETNGLFESHVE